MNRYIIHGVGLGNIQKREPFLMRLKLAWLVMRGRFTGITDQTKDHVVVSASGPHVIEIYPHARRLPSNSSVHAYNLAQIGISVTAGQKEAVREVVSAKALGAPYGVDGRV